MQGNEKEISFPNKSWEKFFARFDERKTLNLEEWKPIHLLSYFSEKYKQKYNIQYSFKFNTTAPSKSFEVWQMNKLGTILSTDPKLLKEYIDWVFEAKTINLKKRFSSISFLTKEEHVREFKLNHLMVSKSNNDRFDRAIGLPKEYLSILLKHNLHSIQTYGDLSFLLLVDKSEEINQVIAELKNIGFNEDILNKII